MWDVAVISPKRHGGDGEQERAEQQAPDDLPRHFSAFR
jgi:hypothetical protein